MPERTIERLKPRIGNTVESVEGFTVEAGKVAEFAAALGDENPIYRNLTAATERGYERRPAPPTFTRTSMFPRYRPEGTSRLGIDLGFDIRYELHGEQAYEFERPVYVGDTLSATTTLADAYEREGQQGGTMTFAVLKTEFVDEVGDPVVTECQTVIETDGPVSGNHQTQQRPKRDATPKRGTVRQPDAEITSLDSAATVEVGDLGPTVIVENLMPQDFIRYAGASGDFNPIHYDDQYARTMGNPGVFGPGMFTAGHAGHLVADWFGLDALSRFQTRFTARVWPGDTLTVSGEVTDIDAPDVSAELTVTRQTGETVLLGNVTATLPVGL